MGKAKKGKRTDKDDDFDSDVEVNDTITDEPVKSKKSKEKKKKGDDVDDLADDLKDLKVEKSKGSKKEKKSKKKGGDSDDDMPAPKGKADSGSDSEDDAPKGKQKNRKNQPTKKGFAALSIESDNDESDTEKSKSKAKGKKGKRVDSDDDEDEVKTSKNKNKKKDKKRVESDDEDSENDTRKAKGKGKKGKKAIDSEASDNEEVIVKAKNKSNAKKNKKKESDNESEDEVPKPKGKTKDKKGKKVSESDEEFQVPTKPVKVVTPKAPKASFALLNMDDDDDDENDEAPSPPPTDDESEKTQSVDRSKSAKQPKAQESQKESKKGKKGKKKRQDSDEDIDKVLAELEMEYSGQKKPEIKEEAVEQPPKEEETAKKGKKAKDVEPEQADVAGDGEEGGTVKTAAQKKKEKKEREKQKKLAQKKTEAIKKTDAPKEPADAAAAVEKPPEKPEEDKKEASDAEGEGDDGKKKKKKGAKEEVPAKEKTKGPGKKMIAAMQEALKKAKEEEERVKREAEEKLRQEEELERLRLEKLQKEQEKKEKKKLKEKQRKEKLKAEGKFLTAKQKQDKARAQAMIEALKAQGLDLPEAGQKAPRPGTRVRPGKLKQQTSAEAKEEAKKPEEEAETDQLQVEIVDKQEKPEVKKEDEKDSVKDAWDAETSEEEAEEDKSEETPKESTSENAKKGSKATEKESTPEEDDESLDESESESEGSDSESEDNSDEDSEGDDKKTDAERRREKVLQRIRNRRTEAEKKRTTDDLRAAVVCVLGHVDTGKTKILDKLRRTNVQDGEAGGITQQIGATNVPIEAIQESTKLVKGFAEKVLKLPGLLIIDTPGHESFSNLRNRGSSLCDIAILVVDIMHGLEPQTIESIELLKKKKCPFVVALNKIDRLFDWESMGRKDVRDIVTAQGQMTQQEFDKRSKEVILQFAEKVGLNAALFYENPDPRSYVSLVPTSAITGEGMGNLLALIVDACQGPLAKRLMYSEELQATVLEVKALPGLGTTIDCILVNGMLREGDTMIVAGTEGPIVTQIRSLLMPQPLKELRVKNAYVEHREVKAAQGVKIAAKELEKAIAGLNLLVAQKPDEVEIMRDEIARELKQALSKIKLAERGVFVQASTLGALEALLEFLKDSKIPYAGIRIGPVVKKDVMKASIMLEHDVVYATILAFDVKIERDAQELADTLGVKIFQADIIYHLFDRFTEYKEQLKQRKRDEFKHIAVFPCKLKVLPQFVFKSRDPIVMGVMVEAGILKEGTPICVPSKEFVDLGVVTSIECNHKQVETARKGQEVCIKIEPIPGEAPKMYGRHFEEKDMLVSKISRQSIDACKDYFRDDLMKSDWTLMVELKKLFQIL